MQVYRGWTYLRTLGCRRPGVTDAPVGSWNGSVILVTGATGLNGSAVVRCLSARGVPVRALVRDVRKAQTLAQLPGVTMVEGDMSQPETLRQPLMDVDRAMLISSADSHMAEVQLNFVAAAREAG